MDNPINGIKKEIDQLKHNIDGMKADVQSTVAEVKDTVNEAKDTFASWKKDGEVDADAGEVGVIVKETNAFVIHEEGAQIAEITYVPADANTWVINHTYVSPAYRGGDLAKRLLRRVADEARAEGKKIIPVCSYAVAQFRRHAEYADVWKQS